jgi:hypothetical protein
MSLKSTIPVREKLPNPPSDIFDEGPPYVLISDDIVFDIFNVLINPMPRTM